MIHLAGWFLFVVAIVLGHTLDAHAQETADPPTSIEKGADVSALWNAFEHVGVVVVFVLIAVAIFDLFRRASGA